MIPDGAVSSRSHGYRTSASPFWPVDPVVVDDGRRQRCVRAGRRVLRLRAEWGGHLRGETCHGVTGVGDTPSGKSMKVKSFSVPEIRKMTDAALIEVTKNGSGKIRPTKTS
jgi:hypothetical protein